MLEKWNDKLSSPSGAQTPLHGHYKKNSFNSNVIGFIHILQICYQYVLFIVYIKHCVYNFINFFLFLYIKKIVGKIE